MIPLGRAALASSDTLGANLKRFVKNLVGSGRHAPASGVMREGSRLVEERGRRRRRRSPI
jgi:Arc/MetJ-type ribon-helix-helix transcriptional regulator